MKRKGYILKIYNLDGSLNKVLPAPLIMSGITFSESINAGQGEMRVKLNLPFSTTDIAYNKIVKVFVTDDEELNSRQIYSGIIGNIRRVNENSAEYIEIRCIGLASMLTWVYYQYTSSYVFTRNIAQDVNIKEIIDYFNTIYPNLISYTGSSIEASVGTANISFSYQKCLDALNTIVDAIPTWWWSVDSMGVVQFHPISGSSSAVTHFVTVGDNIDTITVEENSESVVNKYIMKYSGGGPGVYTDATSTSTYGLRELYEDRSDKINGTTTADTAGNAYISEKKDFTSKITIQINSNYDIDSVRVGHFLTVRNLEYAITSLQIKKLDYNYDNITVELEYVTSFAKEVSTS